MDIFLKAAAGILITVVLTLSLERQSKDMASLLSIAVCVMVVAAAAAYLRPVLDFFDKLDSVGKLDPAMMRILLKAVGVGILAEITAMICTDSGNSALGRSIRILAIGVILVLSLPLFESLLELIGNILVMI